MAPGKRRSGTVNLVSQTVGPFLGLGIGTTGTTFLNGVVDGKISTGKIRIFMSSENREFPVDFPLKQSIDLLV